MHDTVYIVVVRATNEYVCVYATRERAEKLVNASGMTRDYYYIMAQTPVW
jgi:hypothetical protein